MKRREFLGGDVLGSVRLLGGPGGNLDTLGPTLNPFTLGVASGDPTPDGVVLWTRLARDPLTGGGMPPIPFFVRWRVAHDPRMCQVVRQGIAIAWPATAHAVEVEVRGLSPDRRYYFQFSVGGAESPIGRTRALPTRGPRVQGVPRMKPRTACRR
jgi:alkaline phosphatase D